MDVKKWLKKVNRGLILGGAIVVGMIIFIIADTISFNDDKPTIESELKEYVDQMSKAMIVDSKDLDDNGVLKADVKEQKKQQLTELVNKYWGDTLEGEQFQEYDMISKTDMLSQINNMYSDEYQTCNIEDYINDWNKVTVSRYGSNAASVSFNMNSITTIKGYTGYITPLNVSDITEIFDYADQPGLCSTECYENVSSKDWVTRAKSFERKIEEQYDTYQNMYFVKEDGQWKISYMCRNWGCGSTVSGKVDVKGLQIAPQYLDCVDTEEMYNDESIVNSDDEVK